MRRLYHLMEEEEVRVELLSVLSLVGPPVELWFEEKACTACGQSGDPRLMSGFCHLSRGRRHPGRLELFHPFAEPTREHPGKVTMQEKFCFAR